MSSASRRNDPHLPPPKEVLQKIRQVVKDHDGAVSIADLPSLFFQKFTSPLRLPEDLKTVSWKDILNQYGEQVGLEYQTFTPDRGAGKSKPHTGIGRIILSRAMSQEPRKTPASPARSSRNIVVEEDDELRSRCSELLDELTVLITASIGAIRVDSLEEEYFAQFHKKLKLPLPLPDLVAVSTSSLRIFNSAVGSFLTLLYDNNSDCKKFSENLKRLIVNSNGKRIPLDSLEDFYSKKYLQKFPFPIELFLKHDASGNQYLLEEVHSTKYIMLKEDKAKDPVHSPSSVKPLKTTLINAKPANTIGARFDIEKDIFGDDDDFVGVKDSRTLNQKELQHVEPSRMSSKLDVEFEQDEKKRDWSAWDHMANSHLNVYDKLADPFDLDDLVEDATPSLTTSNAHRQSLFDLDDILSVRLPSGVPNKDNSLDDDNIPILDFLVQTTQLANDSARQPQPTSPTRKKEDLEFHSITELKSQGKVRLDESISDDKLNFSTFNSNHPGSNLGDKIMKSTATLTEVSDRFLLGEAEKGLSNCGDVVSVDVRGYLNEKQEVEPSLLQVGFYDESHQKFRFFVFDIVLLLQDSVHVAGSTLKQLFEDSKILKLSFDIFLVDTVLKTLNLRLVNLLDFQVVQEILQDKLPVTSGSVFMKEASSDSETLTNWDRTHSAWSARPLKRGLLKDSVVYLRQLLKANSTLGTKLSEQQLKKAFEITSKRQSNVANVKNNFRRVLIDSRDNYRLKSFEFLDEAEEVGKVEGSVPKVTYCNIESIIDVFPADLKAAFPNIKDILEVRLDVGRRPAVMVGDKAEFFSKDKDLVVLNGHLNEIEKHLGDNFKKDNHAGINSELHSVCGLRNRYGDLIGLTIRVGSFVMGCADILEDLLYRKIGDSNSKVPFYPSILVLGGRKSGKTTLIRDMTRKLSSEVSSNIFVIDSVNQVCGESDIPHWSIGNARRMMVPQRAQQGSLMLECLENHNPNILVVDRLYAENSDVCIATRANRVRVIGGITADLKTLISDSSLAWMIGGLEVATTSSSKGETTRRLRRVGKPQFDAIILAADNNFNQFSLILDVSYAVDAILDDRPYDVEVRQRHSSGIGFDVCSVKQSISIKHDLL